MNKLTFIAASLAIALAPLASAEPKRIYLANDDHTDYMWTADAETYNAVFVDLLDFHLRLTDETTNNPAPYQNRFNADGSYWLWQYERQKSPADFARLIARLKSGHISAPLNTLVSCYGAQPVEAVLRGMYYAGRLERRHDLRFELATANENQTLPLGLASLWAGAGAKYSWRGVCGCASQIPNAVLNQRPHEIYWYAGPDDQRVLMKWHSLAPGGNRGSGGYAEAFDPAAAVRFLDADAGFLSRYRAPGAAKPYTVRGAFGFGWDALDRKTGQPYAPNAKDYPLAEHFHVVAERETTSERQVIVSNQEDFFRDFEAKHGAQLPSQSVTFGNEWDLYSASMAETSARVRRAVEKLRAAEAMATLVCLRKPDFMRPREAARDEAFMNLGLYWEHNWTADGPISRDARAAWQERLAAGIERYVDALHADGETQLGALIPKPDAKTQRFFVCNPLGWARTDSADFAYNGDRNIHVRDLSTGLDVPHQFVNSAGLKFLRVLASDVPATGYKVFQIVKGAGTAPTNAAAIVGTGKTILDTTFENTRVKLAVDPDGAIASLIDKAQPDHELAAVIGGLKSNDFAANSTDGNSIEVENSGPVSVTLKCTSNAGRSHVTRITLHRDSDRVEIRDEITENFADVRHWAFSFNLASPDVHTEEVGAIIRAKTKSQGGDYADTHARYDYLTLNHFADITDGANTRGVTLSSSDCAFVKLGRSTPAALDTATAQLNVLAGGQVDGPKLGIPAQNGETHFLQRFGLRAHGGYDTVAAMKFGLEFQNPFVTGAIIGNTNSPYAATNYSLLNISDPSVLLWALKPHDDGITNGIVARVWNLGTNASNLRVTSTVPLASARRVTHIETSLEPLPVKSGALETSLPAQRLESFSLLPNN
jgi:alpha-mannosidase